MYTITRRIEIDAGHRIPRHQSKCFNIHGHRYVIEATCEARRGLVKIGPEEGMVLDFGFLKEEMVGVISDACDHVLMLHVEDPLVEVLVTPREYRAAVEEHVDLAGGYRCTSDFGALYIMSEVPTAENLAAHWFQLLHPRVEERSSGRAFLKDMKVWETPNCWAVYQT